MKDIIANRGCCYLADCVWVGAVLEQQGERLDVRRCTAHRSPVHRGVAVRCNPVDLC